ncbi:hypothetical protein Tco_0570426 [Tanacetum coccineum]
MAEETERYTRGAGTRGSKSSFRNKPRVTPKTLINVPKGSEDCVLDCDESTIKDWLPVLWAKIGEIQSIGPELVQETTNKVILIKEKLKAARDFQKSYVGNMHKHLEFEVGDHVLLKILERIGPIAYRLRLPKELSSVHDTFHVSNLKKCLVDTNLHVPLNEIKINKTLHFVEEPVEIMDRELWSLKS